MKKELKLVDLGFTDLNVSETVDLGGGLGWFWQAAVATFVYNVVADWNDNVAAFQQGMNAAKN